MEREREREREYLLQLQAKLRREIVETAKPKRV